MCKTVLILGTSGRFSRNAQTAFERAGWTVRGFDRQTDRLASAAQGVDVIVNGFNPAYTEWAKHVPQLTEQVIAAARQTGATVIIPGNVYVFGPDNDAVWGGDTEHKAQNTMGRIRIDMERAYRDSGVRTIILRAGDFLDTQASGNWFDAVLTKSVAKNVFTYPGNPDIPHAWAYLPDMARAVVELAEMRTQLNTFEDIPFPGYTASGQQIADAVSGVVGRKIRLKRMSWLPLYLAAPIWAMGRRLLEMRYLWDTPHALAADRFDQLLPGFRVTPLATALASALDHVPLSEEAGHARSTQTSR